MNFRFPIFLDVTGKACLVTGQGYEIPAKVEALVAAGAKVSYVNPTADARIELLAYDGRIEWKQRRFESADLDDCFLVICDCEENAAIFQLAEQRKVLCNAVDDPENCRFTFGSIHRQGDLNIAISTNGRAPALAVRLRQQFEREIGPEYGTLLQLFTEFRPEITSRIADFGRRRELWYELVDSDLLEMLQRGQYHEAAAFIRRRIEAAVNSISHSDTSADSADH